MQHKKPENTKPSVSAAGICVMGANVQRTIGETPRHMPREQYTLSLPIAGNRKAEPRTYDSVIQAIDKALGALMTDHLGIVYLEDVTMDELQKGTAIQALADAKQSGKVHRIGISAATGTALYALANASFDVLVIDYSMGDETTESLLLPLAVHLGVVIISKPSDNHSMSADEWANQARMGLDNPLVDVCLMGGHAQPGVDLVRSLETSEPSGPLHPSGHHGPQRCTWASDPLLQYYHDREWGVLPTTDERWFEFIVLETFQAGLSWKTILNKRLAFRKAFHQFSIDEVSGFSGDDLERLMQDPGIVRNRKKIEAALENARIAQRLRAEYGSLDRFMACLAKSDDVLTGLQKTFRFVGRTTAESIAFATGLIPPPHDPQCWLHTR